MGIPQDVVIKLRERAAVKPSGISHGLIVPVGDATGLGAAALMAGTPHFKPSILLFCGLAFLMLAGSGLQRVKINPKMSDDLPAVVGRLAIAAMAIAPFTDYPIRFFRLGPGTAIVLVLMGRGLAYGLIRWARANGLIFEPTLIVGAGKLGVRLANRMEEHPEYGLHPIGFLDSAGLQEQVPLPILGGLGDLTEVVQSRAVKRVVIAFGRMRSSDLVSVVRACDRLPVELHVMPRLYELGVAPAGIHTDEIWGIPLIRLRRSALRSAAWRVKRAFDLIVVSFLLLLIAPLFAGIAIAVRLSSPGPIFYRQLRKGQQGQVFSLLKFRTMLENEDGDTTWSVADDERVTNMGRFLRRTSLDELPQLINVLRGEMSLVGPRPERPYFVDQYRVAVLHYDDRHRVPAGITGWAQVHGLRGDTSIQDRALFDNFYVENWSLWRDIVIVFRTLNQIRRRGEQ
jgi:exopolysaccharide biosynthesis polyprenyl glycosylphosphotransferase